MTQSSRKRVGAAALLAAALVLVGCNPDPTGGRRPPPPGADVPRYRADVHLVGPGTEFPLTYSWRPGCPVGPEDLRLIHLDYWGFDGERHRGRIIVHRWVEPAVRRAFRGLYRARFQIKHIRLIDRYGGDDVRSMEANNTVGFNCRTVAGTSYWSQHAYGLAVDINPVQNPWVRGSQVVPERGRAWLDRGPETPAMIRDGDAVVVAFFTQGWSWGGHWQNTKDYQHFSSNGQ